MDSDFFLCAAIEWAAVAVGTPDPVIAGLYRELAFCHLLFKRGRYAAVLARLRIVCGVRGRGANSRRTPDRADTLAAAADLLSTLRFRLTCSRTA